MSEIFMQRGLLAQLPEQLARVMPARRLGIICDDNTYKAAASSIAQQMPDHTQLVCLEGRVKPSIETAQQLQTQLAPCDGLLAVGSGTITDLTRYCAHQLAIPFCSFATAASMNGYLSSTCSLLLDGHKRSVAGAPPAALFADLDVLCAAPLALTRAGIGDVLCRSSIEADLILAHHLIDAHYRPDDFTRLRELDTAICNAEDIRSEAFLRLLMEALILGGQLMRRWGSSAPCSQGEHMIAHTYEMLCDDDAPATLHGEAIAVSTLTMLRLQDKLLQRPPLLRPILALTQAYQAKQLSATQCEQLNTQMHELWPRIRAQINQRTIRAASMQKALQQLGCMTNYEQLGWSCERYEQAVSTAHLTRERFTFLDIAAM